MMEHFYLILSIIFIIAITMSMVGKGGGNFYVVTLILAGISITSAAASSQLIMMVTSLAALAIFSKRKKVDWKLALVIGIPINIMAFLGGYFSGYITEVYLKLIFAILLGAISIFLLLPIKEKKVKQINKFGYWNRTFGENHYTVNLWLIIPITSFIGFFAGAVGISGGSFLIPLMVILCGVPITIAVGTSSVLVSATAFMGFFGHLLGGDIISKSILAFVIVAFIGGIIGGAIAVKIDGKKLKIVFVITNLLAAILIIINIII